MKTNDRIDWKYLRPHPDLARLLVRCACGRDFGDHVIDPPHGTEDGACTGFRSLRELRPS